VPIEAPLRRFPRWQADINGGLKPDPDQANGGLFGRSIATFADIDGDAIDDFVVGEPGDPGPGSTPGRGSITLFSGSSRAPIRKIVGPNDQVDDWFEFRLAGVDDLDGDPLSDVLVGAYRVDDSGAADVGKAWVVSSKWGSIISELTHPNPAPYHQFGIGVAGLGDLDGDDIGELAVHANGIDSVLGTDVGAVFIFSGAAAEDTDGDGSGDICDTDDDGDGLIDLEDCAPQRDEVSAMAEEVGELPISGSTVSWTPMGTGVTYDLTTGLLSGLLSAGDFDGASCLQADLTETTYVDPRPSPPANDGYYYLVRAKNFCGASTYGAVSDGRSRVLRNGCP
jgi:hypothetical protein